jgi:hypothetical protein
MDLSAFRKIVHEAARQAGGRVVDIIEPGVTPNFLAARIEIGPAPCYVLCSHANDWAFAEAIEPPLAPLRFIDCPAIAGAMQSLFGLTPFTPFDLSKSPSPPAPPPQAGEGPGERGSSSTSQPGVPDVRFPPQRAFSEHDLRYWKPRTLGDALFNWWD